MKTRNTNKIFRLNLSYLIVFLCIILISSLYAQDLGNIKIGLVHSSLTKKLLHAEENSFYPVQDWELFFLNKKISYVVFDDDGLDDYDFDEVDILILPSIEILSDDGFENIQDFLKVGNGLFILGKLGVQDDDGNHRRNDLLQSLGGFHVSEFLDRDVYAKNHTLYANNFLTHNLQINSRLIVLNKYPLLYAEYNSGKIMKLGEYLNEDISYEDHLVNKSGIVRIEKDNGRLLWFGFQLSQISVDDDTEALQKIIFNSIEWLAGKPIAWVNQWYDELKFAAAFTSIIENPADISTDMLAPFAFSSQVINNNIFISPDAIISHPEEVKKLAQYGDIQISFDEFKYFDLAENEKIKLINDAFKILQIKTKQSLFGIKYLNSSGKKISDKTGSALCDFIINEDNSIYVVNKKSMMPITNFRMLLPSFNYEVHQNQINTDKDLANRDKYYNLIVNSGGFFPVLFFNRFSNYSNTINSENFRKILSKLRSNYCWITSYSSMIKWLINKENIIVNIKETGEKPVLRLMIENRNKDRVENVGVRVILPKGYKNPAVLNRNFNLRYDARTRDYFLIVPILFANQSTTVEVHYDN